MLRDAGNTIITNQAVGIQLTIQQGSAGGAAVYTETFSPTTNAYGLVNLEIGTGITTDDFTTIDWSNGDYFIETAIDATGGSNYSVMGTSQLMSVPYALYAKTSGNGSGPQGDTGVAGPIGPQGLQGDTGITGPVGPQGVDGLSAYSLAYAADSTIGTELAWLASLKGDTGIVGPIGPQGLEGDTGLTGPIGPQGLQGDIGITGPIGPQGIAGINGNDGNGILLTLDNNNGTLTYNYTDGTTFTTSSLTGPAGNDGVDGTNGVDGAIGPAGADGTNGIDGATGPDGADGNDGATDLMEQQVLQVLPEQTEPMAQPEHQG